MDVVSEDGPKPGDRVTVAGVVTVAAFPHRGDGDELHVWVDFSTGRGTLTATARVPVSALRLEPSAPEHDISPREKCGACGGTTFSREFHPSKLGTRTCVSCGAIQELPSR